MYSTAKKNVSIRDPQTEKTSKQPNKKILNSEIVKNHLHSARSIFKDQPGDKSFDISRMSFKSNTSKISKYSKYSKVSKRYNAGGSEEEDISDSEESKASDNSLKFETAKKSQKALGHNSSRKLEPINALNRLN